MGLNMYTIKYFVKWAMSLAMTGDNSQIEQLRFFLILIFTARIYPAKSWTIIESQIFGSSHNLPFCATEGILESSEI